MTSSPAQEAIASWSPDGNGLSYAIFGGRGGIWTVRRAGAGGSWQKPVKRLDWGYFGIWSPDGRTLAFSGSLAHGALYVMPADSGAPRLLADTTGPRAVRGDQARWSDDGHAIYTRDVDSTGMTFWRIPLDGGAPQPLMTFEGEQRSSGGWSNAAGRLAYARSDERSDVWVMEVSTP